MKFWHWLAVVVFGLIAWYLYDKVDSIAFAYVDGKLFPKPQGGFTPSNR